MGSLRGRLGLEKLSQEIRERLSETFPDDLRRAAGPGEAAEHRGRGHSRSASEDNHRRPIPRDVLRASEIPSVV